jgi:hypothetical protein
MAISRRVVIRLANAGSDSGPVITGHLVFDSLEPHFKLLSILLQALAGSAGAMTPDTNCAATFDVDVPKRLSPTGPRRKRGRCDSLSHEHRPPEKISKGYDDTDTDTEMDGLLYSPSSSPSNSPLPHVAATMPQGMLIHRKAFKRDELYYFEDGSCVLLVGDTLFNVGFYLLLLRLLNPFARCIARC